MTREAVVTPFALGSGRSQDWYWPPLSDYSKGVPAAWGGRVAPVSPSGTPGFSVTGAAPAAVAFVVHNGVPCVQITSDAGAVKGQGWQYASTGACPKPRLVKGQNIAPVDDDGFAYRVYITMAYGTVPAADCDTGLEIVCPPNDVNGFILKDGVGGIGWTLQPDGHAALIVQGAGLTRFPILTPGFDPLAFHAYELRIMSATQTQEATLRALVDGVPFQTLSWGAGSILPVLNPAYRQMKTELVNQQGGTQNIFVYRVCSQSSSSEAGLF